MDLNINERIAVIATRIEKRHGALRDSERESIRKTLHAIHDVVVLCLTEAAHKKEVRSSLRRAYRFAFANLEISDQAKLSGIRLSIEEALIDMLNRPLLLLDEKDEPR